MKLNYPLKLLVLQPTPFCNLDCKYCYLPDRSSTDMMTMDTITKVFKNLFSSGLVKDHFSISWHAGEPLVAPVSFYEEAINIIDSLNTDNIKITHSIQTNAVLINQKWCDLFNKYKISIGVSVDGPSYINDKHRVTRNGKGTLHKALTGIDYLRKNNIDYHVISVLTKDSLYYPNELCQFYVSIGVKRIGFNIEEIEGINKTSSLKQNNSLSQYLEFIKKFRTLSVQHGLHVREFEFTKSIIEGLVNPLSDRQSDPCVIISIDSKGYLSTFSPELLGNKSQEYGNFIFGNIHDTSIEDITQFPHFIKLNKDIQKGIDSCKATCEYYSLCGGGAPANKYFENNSFSSTETIYCKLTKQAIANLMLEEYESSIKSIKQ